MNDQPLRLALWSGPRNVSTAILRSFAQRSDTEVFDEPLYAHYLTVSGAQHPGREEVLAAQECDGERVVREVVLGSGTHPVRFYKMMAHHLQGLSWDFLDRTVNLILTRDPRDVLPTLSVQLGEPRLEDTGYAVQVELLRREQALGREPVVLDSRILLENPEGILKAACRRLALPWEDAMLSWPAGRQAYDGVWAPHWYHNVERSTAFAPYRQKTEPFPSALEPLLAQCKPHYEELTRHALRADV
jgi:hypothetical protein